GRNPRTRSRPRSLAAKRATTARRLGNSSACAVAWERMEEEENAASLTRGSITAGAGWLFPGCSPESPRGRKAGPRTKKGPQGQQGREGQKEKGGRGGRPPVVFVAPRAPAAPAALFSPVP